MSLEQATEASTEQEFDAGGQQREMAQLLEATADRLASPQQHSESFIARRIGEEGRARAAAELRQKAQEVIGPPPDKSLDQRVLESLRPAS